MVVVPISLNSFLINGYFNIGSHPITAGDTTSNAANHLLTLLLPPQGADPVQNFPVEQLLYSEIMHSDWLTYVT